LSEFPAVRRRVVTAGPVEPWFGRVDCVLSCFSSAGIDATLAGVPVIQLLPRGSGDLLPHDEWGLLGSIRSEVDLCGLLHQALDTRGKRGGRSARSERPAGLHGDSPPAANLHVFADLGASAAATIAEAVLAARRPAGQGRSTADAAPAAAEASRADSAIPTDPLSADRLSASS